MGVLSGLRGRAGLRLVVLWRAPAAAFEPLVAAGQQPLLHRGHGLAGLCYTRFGSGPAGWLPPPLGHGAHHLVRFVLAEEPSDEGPRAVFSVLGRTTADRAGARVGAKLAGVLLGAGYATADFELELGDTSLELRVSGEPGTSLKLSAELAGTLEGSLFTSAREAEELLARPRVSRPADPLAPALDELGLIEGTSALEPMHLRALDACAPFAAEGLVPDSAFRLTSVRRRPQRAGREASAVDLAPTRALPAV